MRIQMASADKVTVTGSSWIPFRALDIFFQGQKSWVEEKLTHFQKFPNATIKLRPEEYKQKKESARKLVQQKLDFWNQYYGFTWGTVAIRNQSTRWGSCSSRKTLSFHAGIVDLPGSLQDYLIVHELCHLGALHHGSQFWALVTKALPEGKKLDSALKKYRGASIL